MDKLRIKNRRNNTLIIKHWECEQPKAVLVIAHGAAEHINRYEELALFLNKHHIDVYGYDHEGHGINKPDDQEYIYVQKEKGYQVLIDDLEDVCDYAYTHSKRLPLYLLGHSMGSLIARVLLMHTHVSFAGVILSGSMNIPSFLNESGLALSRLYKRTQGKEKVSKLLNHLAFGTLHERISYNKENMIDYIHDPNCGLPFSNASIHDLLILSKKAANKKGMKDMQRTNYFFIAGKDDPFSDKTKQLKELIKEYKKIGLKVDYHFYHRMKHEVLQEDDKLDVYQDILNFINNS